MNVYHLKTKTETAAAPISDVRPLVWALSRMEPEALSVFLDGETSEKTRARRAAGLDILGELLLEVPAEYLDGDADPIDALAALLVLDGVCGDTVGTLASVLVLDGAA